jgi:hypothetical protein
MGSGARAHDRYTGANRALISGGPARASFSPGGYWLVSWWHRRLSAVVARLPADFPAPIVIAQHLDPTRPSQLQEILARSSTLPVGLVDRRAALEAGHVCVVPANRDVEIIDGWMSLKPGAAEYPVR